MTAEGFSGDEIFTLTDEEGNESDFALIGQKELDGVLYLALVPDGEGESGEYVILKVVTEDGEEILVTIDDDDEFDRIADIFDNELFGEIDRGAPPRNDPGRIPDGDGITEYGKFSGKSRKEFPGRIPCRAPE